MGGREFCEQDYDDLISHEKVIELDEKGNVNDWEFHEVGLGYCSNASLKNSCFCRVPHIDVNIPKELSSWENTITLKQVVDDL